MLGNFFNSFYYGKAGKGDYNPENLPANRRQLFFEMLRVRWSALVRLNLLYLLFLLPALIWTGWSYLGADERRAGPRRGRRGFGGARRRAGERRRRGSRGGGRRRAEQRGALDHHPVAGHSLPVHRHYRAVYRGRQLCNAKLGPRPAQLHAQRF